MLYRFEEDGFHISESPSGMQLALRRYARFRKMRKRREMAKEKENLLLALVLFPAQVNGESACTVCMTVRA